MLMLCIYQTPYRRLNYVHKALFLEDNAIEAWSEESDQYGEILRNKPVNNTCSILIVGSRRKGERSKFEIWSQRTKLGP